MSKLCIIGNGIHSKANIQPCLKVLGIKVEAIASEYEEENVSYNDYKEMIEKEKPYYVIIVTKAERQFEITNYCINNGVKRIFVEKPMGMNTDEAIKLEKLAKEKDCYLFVGFMKRYSPCYKLLKDISNKPEFGETRHFNAEFYITSGRKGWNNEIFLKKGGIHFVNLLIWFFGEVDSVKSFSSTKGEEVSLTSIIKFKNGIVGNVNFIGLPSWKGQRETITISGENGYVYNDGTREVYYHITKPTLVEKRWQELDEEVTKIKPVLSTSSGGEQDLYLRGFVGSLKSFFDQSINVNSENVETMKLIDQILESIE